MNFLLFVSQRIDRINASIGKSVSWLILASVLISAGNATIRKMFDTSSNAWLEVQWYLYGAVFLLAAAYTLQKNEHVRIDIVSSVLSKRTRDWIDLFCHIFFLLPFTVLIAWLAFPWVLSSYRSQEISVNAGGLILWPAKALVLIGFTLLTAQALSEIIKRYAVIRGMIEDPWEERSLPVAVVEMEEGGCIERGDK